MSIMQDLYHSEINVSVSWFWDGGIEVKLGDPLNGFVAEDRVQYWGQVEPWLRDRAIEHFPDSLFARMYRDKLSVRLIHREPAAYDIGDWRPSSG
ncbi:hypothetical protein [Mesorhizobium sp. WSM2239]|uniref:Uncharacterized protein n=1 Tax=Mesorhizobium sp. WSM2239 TaxID=3228852 RepID=A0AAU8DHR8_9HYPH